MMHHEIMHEKMIPMEACEVHEGGLQKQASFYVAVTFIGIVFLQWFHAMLLFS
jgi:hypothetical protein